MSPLLFALLHKTRDCPSYPLLSHPFFLLSFLPPFLFSSVPKGTTQSLLVPMLYSYSSWPRFCLFCPLSFVALPFFFQILSPSPSPSPSPSSIQFLSPGSVHPPLGLSLVPLEVIYDTVALVKKTVIQTDPVVSCFHARARCYMIIQSVLRECCSFLFSTG